MNKIYKDFNGNVYANKKSMCKAHNIHTATFDSRIRNGWTLKDALEVPARALSLKINIRRGTTDHRGRWFSSITAMCQHYGISRMEYYSRLRQGWSLKETLTTPRNTKYSRRGMVDFQGLVWSSDVAMCDYYGTDYRAYKGRVKNGWPQKKALLTPVAHRLSRMDA